MFLQECVILYTEREWSYQDAPPCCSMDAIPPDAPRDSPLDAYPSPEERMHPSPAPVAAWTDGQQAVGMHPTGMHSCVNYSFTVIMIFPENSINLKLKTQN